MGNRNSKTEETHDTDAPQGGRVEYVRIPERLMTMRGAIGYGLYGLLGGAEPGEVPGEEPEPLRKARVVLRQGRPGDPRGSEFLDLLIENGRYETKAAALRDALELAAAGPPWARDCGL